MKSFLLLLFLFLMPEKGNSQNLIPNSGFENFSICPQGPSQIDKVIPWRTATTATPDYYNQCSPSIVCVPNNRFGNQMARSGQAYVGMYLFIPINPDYREYIEVQLSSPLIANACYHFEMFVSLGEKSSFYTDDIGVYFSSSLVQITNNTVINFTPHIVNSFGNYFDTASWTRVSGDYTAMGGENYITIGNFKTVANINTVFIQNNDGFRHIYCYIDDVTLSPCIILPVELINFSAKSLKNSVELLWTTATETNNDYFSIERSKDSENFSEIQKADGAGNSSMNFDYKFIDKNPLNGISYYRLKQVDFDGKYSYSKIIDVNFSGFQREIRIDPNPASTETTIYFPEELKGETKLNLYNSQGEIVLQKCEKKEMSSFLLNLESFEKGIYFLLIENNQQYYRSKLIMI